MKERPILFSAPMVRALLAGTKTQTRRLANKPVRHPDLGNIYTPGALVLEREPQHVIDRACPYGQPGGDLLWVREAWRAPREFDSTAPRDIPPGTPVWYEAQDEFPFHPSDFGKLRQSIHMPRAASRITLEITGVRVERLQDINEADAMAEGIEPTMPNPGHWNWRDYLADGCQTHAVLSYKTLWESINGPGSWDANPWVWVIEFRRVEGGAA